MDKTEKKQRTNLSAGEKIALLIAGGGIGATVALLLAPKRGEVLREDISEVSRKSLERTRETANEARQRAAVVYHSAEEQARRLAEKARQSAIQPRSTLTAAIEAGKQAYWAEKRRTEAASILKGRAAYPYELGEGDKQ